MPIKTVVHPKNKKGSILSRGLLVKQPLLLVVFWIAGIVALDQISKWLVQLCCSTILVTNRDAAFSIGVPQWAIFAAFIFLLGLLVYTWLTWSGPQRIKRAWVIGLIIGAALSNIVDRLWLGAVRDFINLHIWPVFNLADVALTVGTLALLWYALGSSKTSHAQQGEQQSTRGGH